MSRRVYLPMLEPDRRLVLRGLAASLLASLTGCETGVRESSLPPDADLTSSRTPGLQPNDGVERCGNDLCVDLRHFANEALQTVDGARIIAAGGKRYLLVRIAVDQVIALSAVCTHKGCLVRYAAATSDIRCPCHGSRFALDGAVNFGPALHPLDTYPATYDADLDLVRVTIA